MKFLDQESQKPTFPKFDIICYKYMPGGDTSDDDPDEEDKPTGDRD